MFYNSSIIVISSLLRATFIRLGRLFLACNVIILGLFSVIGVAPVFAQEDTSTEQVTGELTRIENRTLTLDVNGTSESYTIPDEVLVEINQQESEFADLDTGDQVTLALNSEGEVTDLDAISGDLLEAVWWIGGFLVVVIIVGSILFWLYRRSRKGEILTTQATRTNQ